ncbi:hypothetical protein HPY86_03445 [candidate division WOR-3 bacterium]|nr:hypothetical protein [candidate division WOR-3 bacterium]
MKVKAVSLLSGGLDSILACRVILDQGIEVFGLNFVSPFCTCTRKGCRHEARRAAEQLGIPLKVVAKGEEYIQMIKKPRHGYGSAMNPCIDCRIFTFRRAKEYMEEIGAQFVFTGEVLGERPMSQHLQALKLIERESGLQGRVLRPLSAKLLEPTIPEIEGWVDRQKLLAIQGRSRKPQIALAAHYGIKDYPCPAGGCLLTDKNFAQRLKDAFAHNEDSLRDMNLLKVGRHFRLPSGRKVVVGRNEMENRVITNLINANDVVIEPVDVAGPVVVVWQGGDDKDVEVAARLCARYSDGKNLPRLKVRAGNRVFEVAPLEEETTQALRVG